MCGITGIINFHGLTGADLVHFRQMFLKTETRGRDAAGIGNQAMDYLKWSEPASRAKLTDDFNRVLQSTIGQKWIIGHARAATRGSPQDLTNNHPIPVEGGKALLVHNGIVGTSSGIKEDLSKTDSYIIATAINQAWIEGDLFTTVQNAYKLFYGAAAICVWNRNEVVIARRLNPIVAGKLADGSIVFGSTHEIVKGNGETKVIDVTVMKDDKIVGFDAQGNTKDGKLEYVKRPISFNSDWRVGATNTSVYGRYFNDEDDDLSDDTKIGRLNGKTKRGSIQTTLFTKPAKPGEPKETIKLPQGWFQQPGRHSKAAKLGNVRKKFGKLCRACKTEKATRKSGLCEWCDDLKFKGGEDSQWYL